MVTRIESIKSLSAQLKRKGYANKIENMKKEMFKANESEVFYIEKYYRALKKRA